jgi:hypothetical protein
MNAPSKDIANILNDETSVGLTLATDLFYARMPDGVTLDNCVSVMDNPGNPVGLTLQKSTSNYFKSSVTVYVRDLIYDDAYEQAYAILTYLHGLHNVVEDGTLYMLFKAVNEPQLLYFDENKRTVMIINFEVHRKPNN